MTASPSDTSPKPLTYRDAGVDSDAGNQVARRFGLVFTLPAELREFYISLGIDLPKLNGDGSWELPLAATYLIDQSGIIRDVFVNTDYVKRMEPEDILSGLRSLQSK